MSQHRNWTRNELLLAMNLYCRLPFGKMHKGNPDVVALSAAIGRTPSSVAMKLVNLASLDPAQRARGISGLTKASAADRAIWNEFHSDWHTLAVESEKLYSRAVGEAGDLPSVRERRGTLRTGGWRSEATTGGVTEAFRTVAVRIAQQFFRRAVLASYGGKCCVSRIAIEELLVASHVAPWSEFPEHRVNPRNGLCLSRLHDAAFDRGLITFDEQFRMVVSRRLADHGTNRTIRSAFQAFEGRPIALPEKFLPDPLLLERHRQTVFVD